MMYDVKFTETFVSHIKVEANDKEQAREIAEHIVEQGDMVEEMVSCSYEVKEAKFFDDRELIEFIDQKFAEFKAKYGIIGGDVNFDIAPLSMQLATTINNVMTHEYKTRRGGE